MTLAEALSEQHSQKKAVDWNYERKTKGPATVVKRTVNLKDGPGSESTSPGATGEDSIPVGSGSTSTMRSQSSSATSRSPVGRRASLKVQAGSKQHRKHVSYRDLSLETTQMREAARLNEDGVLGPTLDEN